MKRRSFTVTTASLVSVATSVGCLGLGGGGSGDNSSPEKAAETFGQAYIEGDYETIDSLTIGEANEQLDETQVAEQAAAVEEASLEETIVEEQSDGEATVNMVMSAETEFGTDSETTQLDMVEEDGGWVIESVTDA